MATIVTREGVILSQPTLTDEQRAEGWCIFLRALLRENPEALTGGQEAAEPSTSSV